MRHLGAGGAKMTTNHTAQTLITYGSQYGSTEHYAKKFAEYIGFQVLPYCDVKNAVDYARVIHFGARRFFICGVPLTMAN